MIQEKLDNSLSLIIGNNKLVARIQESKNTDPNNVEYQDATWKRVADEGTDQEIVAAEAEYQDLIARAEELLKTLREKSREHMQPAMSEEDIAKSRKLVNEGKSAIEESLITAKGMAEMADQMLTLANGGTNPIGEGGVISLMPKVQSLIGTRGGKSRGAKPGEGYALRIGSASIDGENVEKNGKVTWAILADTLSNKFNAKAHSENAVSALELEEAFFAAIEQPFRDKTNIPDAKDFVFSKEIAVQNPNDDSVTMVPQNVNVHFEKWVPAEKTETTEVKSDDNVAPANEGDANVAEDKPKGRRK
jgi:hypothetical protein